MDRRIIEYAGMGTILDNAITSISIGVEDFLRDSNSRNLSAIRNIYSGVLLLFKEKLRRLSPEGSNEVLVKEKISVKLDEKNNLIFVGDGKKTVGLEGIKKRFKSLGIPMDWSRIDRIKEIRNSIEHYQLGESPKLLVELINNCFAVIRCFLIEELDMNPIEVFEINIWEAFLRNEEVFEQERDVVKKSHENSGLAPKIKQFFGSIDCMHCGSELVELTDEGDVYDVIGYCRTCGKDNYGPIMLERAIEISTGYADYRSVKEGGSTLFDYCPECSHRTLCNEEGICYVCEYQVQYKECWRCGCSLSVDEQHLEGLCSYCKHMLGKVQEE